MADLSIKKQALFKQRSLIDACISGNRSSQEVLYKTFSPRMFAICLRYADNYQSAEDILQEGFIKVFNNLDKFRSDGSFEGWMKRIFVNTSIEHYRKSQQGHRYVDIDECYNLKLGGEDALGKIARQDMLSMVQKLPSGYRTVFNLYAIEGFTHREIAKKLTISEGTSKSQLARARAMLQKMIKQTR